MELTKQELGLAIEALSHYADETLPGAVRALPGVERSGSLDAARGQILLLVARLRAEATKPEPPLEHGP